MFAELAKKQQVRAALLRLKQDKDFQLFWKQFLKDCGVTRSKFSRDPNEIVWNESKRHLAMSYLQLLADDTADHLEKEITEYDTN